MAMTDWQQYTQSVIFGLIFSFLLAKLFSIVFTFRDENVQVTSTNPNTNKHTPDVIPSSNEKKELLIDEQKKFDDSNVNENADDDDDDWEGVESTELDEAFSAATAYLAARAADRSSVKVSSDLQLKLYGLYKIATEGPCSVAQPSAIKMTARAKWKAWHKLGAMPPEEAMQKYLEIVTELYPTWANGSTYKKRDGDSNEPSGKDTRPVRPVFSYFVHEEESRNEQKLDAIHDFARKGDVENLLKCVDSGVSVDTQDSEGRTPLHLAVDRGHTDAAELLLSRNADVNIKDNEGQTPLHYVCEREAIAELLMKGSAGIGIKDDDGNYPSDL